MKLTTSIRNIRISPEKSLDSSNRKQSNKSKRRDQDHNEAEKSDDDHDKSMEQ